MIEDAPTIGAFFCVGNLIVLPQKKTLQNSHVLVTVLKGIYDVSFNFSFTYIITC